MFASYAASPRTPRAALAAVSLSLRLAVAAVGGYASGGRGRGAVAAVAGTSPQTHDDARHATNGAGGDAESGGERSARKRETRNTVSESHMTPATAHTDTLAHHRATARKLTAEYRGTCAACGGATLPGQRILWSVRVGASSLVTHAVPSDCGGQYTVKVVYESTSKRLHVCTRTADSAIREAAVKTDAVMAAYQAFAVAYDAYLVAPSLPARQAALDSMTAAAARIKPAHAKLGRPSCYVCYQGDTAVGSSMAADVIATEHAAFRAAQRGVR